ncbi:MAG: DUF389 domain-containing protein [Acidimicrobiia bacterium]
MVTADDITRMREQLFFDGEARNRKLSRFWMLLLLSAVIATAGVVADSTATVIGAMIVAPLMTPILGVVLGVTLIDRPNLLRSVGLVLAGAASVVFIAWATGHLVTLPVIADTNSQVSGRIEPRLIDLIAALATGAVGAIALARSDISDTLPGVAIAISLVPPLAVVGLTLEAGATSEALGALLLFGTNVAAILLSGIVVMMIYRVAAQSPEVLGSRSRRRGAVVVIVTAVALVAIPLAITSKAVTRRALREQTVSDVATKWAKPSGWRVLEVSSVPDGYQVRVAGPLPQPDTGTLRTRLDDAGLANDQVKVELVPEEVVVLDPK